MIAENDQELTDLILIRHAESYNNKAINEFVEKNNISTYTWAVVSKNQQFLSQIKYSPKLLDCSISEAGILQCKDTREYTNYLKPDVILVSPLHRTLETCQMLFGKRNIPIFVEPILTQGLRSACDVSDSMKQKIQKYKTWKFAQTLKQNEMWFVSHQLPEMKQRLLHNIEPYQEQLAYDSKKLRVLQTMKQTKLYETGQSLRQRAKKIKLLLKIYKQKYNKICVVAHYNTINYISAHNFDINHEPVDAPCLSNCQVYHASLEQICKYE